MKTDSIQSLAEAVCEALRVHAGSIDGPEHGAAAATEDLRAAALAYATAVERETGWMNVLGGLDTDDEWLDEEEDDDEGAFDVVQADAERLTIRGRWDVIVRDRDALRAYAEQRFREDAPNATDDDVNLHVSEPGGAIDSLLALDMPGRYPGIEDAGAGWDVEPTDKTLFEMTPDERDAAGY